MYRLLRADVYKLRRSIGFRVMMGLSVVFGVIGFVSLAFTDTKGEMEIILTEAEAFYTHFADLRTLMFVFTGIFSGLFIGEDFTCRTFQAEIASGNSRTKVLLSKTIVFGICTMTIVQKAIVTVGVSVINGFGADFTGNVIGNMLRAGLMFMLHISACAMVCVLSCVLIKNKASIIAVNFMILILIDAVLQLLATNSDKASSFYSKTPLVLSLTASLPDISQPEWVISIVIGISTMIGLYMVSNIIFCRCELE